MADPSAIFAREAGAAKRKAARNVARWGMQDAETLALAIAEEAGEIAQAVLQARHEGGNRHRIILEARDLAPLCLQLVASEELRP